MLTRLENISIGVLVACFLLPGLVGLVVFLALVATFIEVTVVALMMTPKWLHLVGAFILLLYVFIRLDKTAVPEEREEERDVRGTPLEG